MTVQDVPIFVDYVGNGATTSFAFVFRVDNSAWVFVDFMDDISGIALNIDQDVNPGGSVDYSVAPPNGTLIHIQRDTPVTQETDYERHDPFDSETNEDNLDKLTMIIQDLISRVDGLTNAINAQFNWLFIEFSGDRTLNIIDAHKMLQSIDNGGTQTVTIPPNSVVTFDRGTQISFEQKGTSILDFVAGAGVNIDAPGQQQVSVQFGTVTLIQDEIDNWVLLGNISI